MNREEILHYRDIAHALNSDTLCHISAEDLAALCRAALEGEWQPIETAPRDGFHTQLYRPEIQFVGYLATESQRWVINAPGLPVMDPPPTHWRPLPKPPKGEVKPALAWDKCERCGEKLVCHCGSYAEEHAQADNHAFSPMPCPCRTEVKP